MTTFNDSKKFIDDLYNKSENVIPKYNRNNIVSISYSSSNINGESNVFSYGYSNMNNVEKEIYYGGKFNNNNSREEYGKSLNKSDFKVKRISNKNKPDEFTYELTKPHYHNKTNNLLENKNKYQLIEKNKETKRSSKTDLSSDYILYKNNFIQNIFNDPFFN